MKNFNPATQDAQQLYDLSEANAHIRNYSIYSQWKELKKYYPELKAHEHCKIIKEYIRSQAK